MSASSEKAAYWSFFGSITAALIAGFFTIVAARNDDPEPRPPSGGGADSVISVPGSPLLGTAGGASAQVENVRVEHDAVENGLAGMRIHARVATSGRKGVQLSIAAYFTDASGNLLRDSNGRYTSADGQVSVGTTLVPAVNERSSQEVAMFIPASELELGPGRYDLRFQVIVYDYARDQVIARGAPVGFWYNNNDAPAAAASAAYAEVRDLWLEHDVFVGGVKGVRVHASFTVNGLAGQKGFVTAFFYFDGGAPLRDFNRLYYSGDGTVSVGEEIVPPYEVSVYNDFQLFLPYDELHMASGRHALEARIAVHDMTTQRMLVISQPVDFTYTLP